MNTDNPKFPIPIGFVFLLQIICIFIKCAATDTAESEEILPTGNNEQISNVKAELIKLIQKETLDLSGFDEFATIPITFPLDICLMEVGGNFYAACLSLQDSQDRNQTVLKVLRKVPEDPNNPLRDYVEIFSYETHSAQSMDCVSMGSEGFIAVVNDVKSQHYDEITEGSPIFQLKDDEIIPIQYFMRPRQNRAQFVKHQDQLLMWQTSRSEGNIKSSCPVLKWSETTFDEFDYIPCTNAMQVEPFIIDQNVYVAVANYMDQHQNMETYSSIFHYDLITQKFNLTQQMKTFGAIDVKHFQIEHHHFLIVANSFQAHGHDAAMTSNAVIYRYEQTKFVPIQILPFEASVTQFLPYIGNNKEFVLLVSMKEGATKTYQYDGFKFYETPISFTGGSLGRGVSKMRTYKISDDLSVIVVANAEMYRDATNLFLAKFMVTLDFDFTKAFDMFDKWHAEVSEKLKTDRIKETFHEVNALKLPPGIGVINLENTKVNTIYTDSISSSAIPIDFTELRKAIQRAEKLVSQETVRRPKRLNDSMLQNDVNSSRFDANTEHIEAEAEETNETMDLPTILYIDELTVSESILMKKINGHDINDLVQRNSNLVLEKLVVDKLLIAENNTENIDEIERKLLNSDERIKRAAPNDTESDTLVFDNVVVQGHVNGIDFNYLMENALRTDLPNQRLEGDISIGVLKANSLNTNDGKISNIDPAVFALISGNETIIRPPIHFTGTVEVNHLTVLQRLNHVLINDGKMDALFKRSRRPQVITGTKLFQSIELLEPIILQGKINISNPVIEKIKPIVTIDEDVVVEGDFIFYGNVTVQNLLQANNIYGKSLQHNVAQLLTDGLRLDEPVIDMEMEFNQPIHVDNVEASTSIDGIPIASFIRTDLSDVQIITARKTFTSDLSIEGGNCDANEINGINLPFLNRTILKKNGKHQIVTGKIQFKRIVADSVNAEQLFIGKTPVDRLLTEDTFQEIKGNVTIRGNILVSNGSNLEIDHLLTNNTIFGVDLQSLLDDCYVISPNETVVVSSNKWFQNLTVDKIVIDGIDFWQMNQSTAEIVQRIDDLRNGIRLQGNITFTEPMSINNLTVTDSINDIPSSSFGKNWLLLKGKQTFTVAQNFTDVTFNDNIQLYGMINGHDIENLVEDTVSKKDPVLLRTVIFDNVIFQKPLTIGGRLSGILFPDDLILSHSDSIQNFYEPLHFASDVNIYGTLSADTLNGYSLSQMCDLLDPKPGFLQRLTIGGDVIFASDPMIEYLNAESFQHLLLTTWSVDDRIVNFTYGMQFENVVFQQPITTTGLVNGIDVKNLNDRYLSLTREQNVTTPLRFQGTVHFRNTLETDKLTLRGLIKVPQSDITLNITDFEKNVLKNTNDTQIIQGRWTVNEMRFLGNLSSTNVNGLNFATDVARWNRPKMNIIRAPKRFGSLTIDRLTCQDGCTLQGVDMDDWVTKSVLPGLNYTIQGRVIIKNPIISYIESLGPVNNMMFNSQNILLKSAEQDINGPVTIGNRSGTNAISSLTFEDIYVNYINDKSVNDFFGNLILKDENFDGEIFTNMVFTQPLQIWDLNVLELNGIDLQQLNATDQPYQATADPDGGN